MTRIDQIKSVIEVNELEQMLGVIDNLSKDLNKVFKSKGDLDEDKYVESVWDTMVKHGIATEDELQRKVH